MSTTEQKALALRLADQLEDLLHDWIVANDAAAELRRLSAENEALRAKNNRLEELCDATYVAQGADAYNHACSEMERFQAERAKAKKEVGTTGSLCDGLAWLYGHVDNIEAECDALRAQVEALTDAPAYQGSGLNEQLMRAVEASEAGHDPFCMSILRGKDCNCGFERAQVEALTRDTERQASKITELCAELEDREARHQVDRERLQTIHEHQQRECWYWQGDGEDHLESMVSSLPVVIRADQLRALTKPAAALMQACDLLSTSIGLVMGWKEGSNRDFYKTGSVVDKHVQEVVEFLKPWPENAPQALTRPAVPEGWKPSHQELYAMSKDAGQLTVMPPLEWLICFSARVLAAAPQPEAQPTEAAQPVQYLQKSDQELLDRFIETTEDDESFDIGMPAVKRLADLGVVRNCGFGRYAVTMFGYWVHEHFGYRNPPLPLMTNADRDAAQKAKLAAQKGGV